MSHDTFLIVCAILIVIPFIVSCIKGNPVVGATIGIAAFLIMSFAAAYGASMLGVLVIGILFAGVGTSWVLHGD